MGPWRRATSTGDHDGSGEQVELDRCALCGTARTRLPASAQDADLEALYRSGPYLPAKRGADIAIEPLRRLAERDKLRSLPASPAGRVLEVGAGDGRFVDAMRSRGIDAWGIEPAGEQAGDRVERLGIDDVELQPDSLDGAVLWHVLEHLERPAAAVAKLGGALRDGGWIVIACPNLDSVQARIGGDRWFHQDVPRHRTHFTARGLRMLCERQGLRVEALRHWVLEQNPLGMWVTLLNLITRDRDIAFELTKRDRRAGARDLLALALAGPPLAPVALAGELLASALRRGGTVVVRARR